MTRAKRMKPVQNLFDDTERRLAMGLATTERKVADAETKLQELERYRGDYQAFLARLTEAIRQQQAVVKRAQSERDAERRRWQEAAKRAKALGHVVEQWQTEERRASDRREQHESDEQDMTPTNLPVQPSTPATPAAGSAAAPTEQAQTTDFLLMLGQLVAASIQRSGTTATPSTKVPSMILDETAKKDEIDPEQLLAMFSMSIPPQVQPIDVPVENELQALPGMSAAIVAEGAEAPAKGILQEVARQVGEASVFADIVDDVSRSADAAQAPDSLQGATPFQLQQSQATQVANAHAHNAMSRPVHAPVGSAAWADEVGTRVVMMTESGNHTASLKLSPEHLGPLEINITVRDDKASVWFGAAHADTRAAIETALPRLREMFEAQGLSLADAGVFREPPRGERPVVKNDTMSAEQGDGTDEVTTVSSRARLGSSTPTHSDRI